MGFFVSRLIIFCWSILQIQNTNGEQEILRNGTMDVWFFRSFLTGSNGEIWSQPNSDSQSFSRVQIRSPVNGSWLITNYIRLKYKTQLLYVDIEASVQTCFLSKSCYLEVFIYKKDDKPDIPLGEKVKPEKTKRFLSLNFVSVANVTLSSLNKKETRTFTFRNDNSNVTLGIRARGLKGRLYRMKMYYYYCEEKVRNSVQLVHTLSLPNRSKEVLVNCTKHSVPARDGTILRAFCQRNGSWDIGNDTACFCREGFWASNGCIPCPKDHYKAELSNSVCHQCPSGNTNTDTNTSCQCVPDRYRLPREKDHVAARCYGLPSKVRELKAAEGNYSGAVVLTWDSPSETGGLNKSLQYSVMCNSCLECSSCDKPKRICNVTCAGAVYKPRKDNLNETRVTIAGLTPGRTYRFLVFSRNAVSDYVDMKHWKSDSKTYDLKPAPSIPGTQKPKEIYFIATSVGVCVIFILLVALACTLRHKNRTCGSKIHFNEYGMPLSALGQRMFIDPSNYDDPEYALKEFANEVDPKSLSLECVIGGGEFGDVYKGSLTLADGSVITVAAKTLKINTDEKSRRDFFLEASAMGQFDDSNVIHLEGVITKVLPKMIITEFMSSGSLDNFLKKNDEKLTHLQMIGMARGVASGMKYLAAMNFVHRDLAARNILVSDSLVCKVADFGLSRELETEDISRGEYFTSGGKIPVRWTAPEAIKYRKFSMASDVWSYGILLWEIMSFAQRPYWDWDNYKVMERVDQGFRLPSPMNCPMVVYELMLKCWEKDRGLRPQFEDIVKTIDEWIRSPETIIDGTPQERQSGIAEAESSPSIKEWLDEIKMSSYVPFFTTAGYEYISDLAGLLDTDLKAMGITLVGHRNKILRSIRSLPIYTQQKPTASRK